MKALAIDMDMRDADVTAADEIHKDEVAAVAEKLEQFGHATGVDTANLQQGANELSALAGHRGAIGDTIDPKKKNTEISNWWWGWPF